MCWAQPWAVQKRLNRSWVHIGSTWRIQSNDPFAVMPVATITVETRFCCGRLVWLLAHYRFSLNDIVQFLCLWCWLCSIRLASIIWLYITRSIWKMLGPFATASRRTPHCHSPGVATVASHAACASMSTTTTTTTTTRDRGDRYGPIEWAQLRIYMNVLFLRDDYFVITTILWRDDV